MTLTPRLVALLPLLGACNNWRQCELADSASLAGLPERLSETGLYADIATGQLADGVLAFTPRHELWADGADKARWLLLPDGAGIDGTDPDAWVFPEGTRAWKAFSVGGVLLETRLIEKVGPDAWAAVAYQWDADGADATALPEGAEDVGGTTHDIPAAEDCLACHGGRSSFVLGFSAVQLAGAEGYDLDQLVADGLISGDAPSVSTPTALDGDALGYLHANCSHCHNPDRAVGQRGARCYDPGVDLDFTLPAQAITALDQTPALQTASRALGAGPGPGSEVLERMGGRKNVPYAYSMPPLGTEEVDEAGLALIESWLDSM